MTIAHWREYGAEAAALALFMVSATAFTVVLEHPASPVHAAVPDPFVRRALMGLAMGATAAALIYSPLGARSGAHLNPAVTLAFLRLGRIRPADAAGYVLAQCAGAWLGSFAAASAPGMWASHPSVNYVLTLPGPDGAGVAAAAEMAISFFTLSVVLAVGARPGTMRATGLVAGLIVCLNITFEAPLSGMSMNPARSLGPALVAGNFSSFWIYALVPLAGMQLAAALHRVLGTGGCAKLHHPAHVRCIFCHA